MKKNTYLIENDRISGGGAEKILQRVAEKLLAEGHDVTVAAPEGTKAEFYRLYPRGVKYEMLKFPWPEGVERFTPRWLLAQLQYRAYLLHRKRFDKRAFDVAVAMKEGPCMQDIARRRARRHCGFVHVDYRYLHWTKQLFRTADNELACFGRMDRVICVSQAAADGVIETIGDPGNLTVCYNPIDAAGIQSMAAEVCPCKRQAGKPLFVSIGRLAQEKQYPMLIEACHRLSETYDFELWIVGDGPQRQELEQMLLQKQLHCVKLLGAKDNPYPYLKQADWFISASLAESYGLAVQEALILGIPVLTTDCPAMRETLPEAFGKIVPNDLESLCAGMELLLCKPELTMHYRANLQARFDTKQMYAPRLEKIYRMLEGESL